MNCVCRIIYNIALKNVSVKTLLLICFQKMVLYLLVVMTTHHTQMFRAENRSQEEKRQLPVQYVKRLSQSQTQMQRSHT